MGSFDDEVLDESDTDSAEPTKGKARNSFAVLKSLADDPFEQAVKLDKYLKAADKKKEKLVASVSEAALDLYNTHRKGRK